MALAGASIASATVTIGQLAPGTSPTAVCGNPTVFDLLQATVTSGNAYVVPPGGAKITSWSNNAAAGAGQQLKFKVYRLVSGSTYQVVAHDGPRNLTPSAINTFAVNLAVQPGDVIGLNDVNPGAVPNACLFSALGQSNLELAGDLADGGSGAFTSFPNFRVNATAVVAIQPSNLYSFGKVKANKNNGTATLAVTVPGPGTLTLKGKGVKTQRPGRAATASKAVSAAGTVKLKIKAKGKTKSKLSDKGKAKVKVKVTYTPSGDLPGVSNTQTKRVKLIKKD
jgi:hypothetical protein